MREQWTPEKVVARFEHCVWVLSRLPGGGGGSEYASYWPEIIYTPQEINRQPARRLRLRPLPSDIDKMEETLKWLQFVDEIPRKLIWLHASGATWRAMASKTGVSPRTARRYLQSAWQHIAYTLELELKGVK